MLTFDDASTRSDIFQTAIENLSKPPPIVITYSPVGSIAMCVIDFYGLAIAAIFKESFFVISLLDKSHRVK